eukprot:jgi/Mesen1/7948/ME000422S07106
MSHPGPVNVITVRKDGSGQFQSIQAAVDHVPLRNTVPVTIQISPGTYTEQVLVPFSKDFITLQGQSSSTTVLTFGAFVNKPGGPDGKPYNTYNSGTIQIQAKRFTAVGVTFRNEAGPTCGGASGQNQAVAARVTSDCAAFYACVFLGFQDTLYAHQFRQRTLSPCGSQDINHMSSPLREAPKPGVAGPCYLGRPWRNDARVIVANSHLDSCIPPGGWDRWDGNTDVARPSFWEFQNTGPGAIQGGKATRFIGKAVGQADVAPFLDLPHFFGQAENFPGPSPLAQAPPLVLAPTPPGSQSAPSLSSGKVDAREYATAGGRMIVVDKGGRGHYASVQQAIDSVPLSNRTSVTIYIKPGVYREQARANAPPELTSGDSGAGVSAHVEEIERLRVEADDFTAVGVTFRNDAGPACGGASGQHQAAAARVTADRAAFYACAFLGFQDTLYAHRGNVYFERCLVEGSVDFVFGGPHVYAWFGGCRLQSRGPGWCTAQFRDLEKFPGDRGGFVFDGCAFTASRMLCSAGGDGVEAGSVYLGRPWQPDARVVLLRCFLGRHVARVGWDKWDQNTDPARPTFLEFKSAGPGALQSNSQARDIGKTVGLEEVAPFLVPERFFSCPETFPGPAPEYTLEGLPGPNGTPGVSGSLVASVAQLNVL